MTSRASPQQCDRVVCIGSGTYIKSGEPTSLQTHDRFPKPATQCFQGKTIVVVSGVYRVMAFAADAVAQNMLSYFGFLIWRTLNLQGTTLMEFSMPRIKSTTLVLGLKVCCVSATSSKSPIDLCLGVSQLPQQIQPFYWPFRRTLHLDFNTTMFNLQSICLPIKPRNTTGVHVVDIKFPIVHTLKSEPYPKPQPNILNLHPRFSNNYLNTKQQQNDFTPTLKQQFSDNNTTTTQLQYDNNPKPSIQNAQIILLQNRIVQSKTSKS